MIKFIYPMLCLTFAAGTASARTLSAQEALRRIPGFQNYEFSAEDSGEDESGEESGLPHLILTGETPEGSPAYYLFSVPQEEGSSERSTMVVSASTVALPLLGVADGRIRPSQINPALQAWLEGYAAEIGAAESAASTSSIPMVSYSAGASAAASRQDIAPLCSAVWDQVSPYNDYCPVIDNDTTLAGCVAIACGEIMKHFNWPPSGEGSISYYWRGQQLSEDFSQLSFDWDLIANAYLDDVTSSDPTYLAKRAEVAKLVKALGYSVEMYYGLTASSASITADAEALATYFHYSKGVNNYYREYYTTEQWEQMIYDNLLEVGPVFYTGQSATGGHAFVCDGYNAADNTFHFNWGWFASDNGYFVLSALNPVYAGEESRGYNYNQSATLGITPDLDGTSEPVPYMVCGDDLGCTILDRTLQLEAGNSAFYNMCWAPVSVDLGIAFTSEADPTVTLTATAQQDVELQSQYGTPSITAEIPDAITSGTWRAVPVFASAGTGDWKPVTTIPGTPSYALLNMDDGAVTTGLAPEVSAEGGESAAEPRYFDLQGREVKAGDAARGTILIRTLPGARPAKIIL